ncbi:hypothetical protein Esi_0052_0180 [Ectocarpus siliculosus]|uniref:Uncharacterized protein n=1 Tax=Ectocarpus siliculosus TaxID=2880 RepID=D8LPL6_ECTSI|nr:hypothetical protein Esi_0052_0180 [Ectocarpus siliculosus]|eukprot:CBN80488.1 hypothetical protein Esi_0052_0180 [Ectocarpus siliculosus]
MEVADSTWELAHGCLTFAECVVKNTSLKADNLEHAVLKVQQLLTALRPPAPVSTAASAADVTVEGGAPVVSASVPMQAAGSSHEMEGDSCDVVNAAGVTVQDGAPVVAGSSNKMEYDSYESSTDAEPDSDYVGTDEQEDDQLEPRRSKREGKGKISRT